MNDYNESLDTYYSGYEMVDAAGKSVYLDNEPPQRDAVYCLEIKTNGDDEQLILARYVSLIEQIKKTDTSTQPGVRVESVTEFLNFLKNFNQSGLYTFDDIQHCVQATELFDMKKYLAMMKQITDTCFIGEKRDNLQRCVQYIERLLQVKKNDVAMYIEQCKNNQNMTEQYNLLISFNTFLCKRMLIVMECLEEIACSDYASNDPVLFNENMVAIRFPIIGAKSQPIDSSSVDYNREAAKAIQRERDKRAAEKSDQSTTLKHGVITTVIPNVDNNQAFSPRSSGYKLPGSDAARDPKAARNAFLARFDQSGSGNSSAQKPVSKTSVSKTPLTVGKAASPASTLLSRLEAADENRKKTAQLKIKMEKEALDKKNLATIQAHSDANQYSQTKAIKTSPSSSPSYKLFQSPIEESHAFKVARINLFERLKQHLFEQSGLRLKGDLFDRPQTTANGLGDALLAHYEGYDRTQLVLDHEETDAYKIIHAISSIFSTVVRKNVLIMTCDEKSAKYTYCLDYTFCDKDALSSNLNQPLGAGNLIFVLNYPDEQGDRYYCLINHTNKPSIDILKSLDPAPFLPDDVPEWTDLKNWPFRIKKTAGKGDCMFIAIGNQLGLTPHALRAQTASTINADRAHYSPFLDAIYEGNMDLYLSKLRRPCDRWGDDMEISAIQTKYRERPIFILRYDLDKDYLVIYNLSELRSLGYIEKMQELGSQMQPVWLAYKDEIHYDEVNFTGDDLHAALEVLVAATDEYNTQNSFKRWS